MFRRLSFMHCFAPRIVALAVLALLSSFACADAIPDYQKHIRPILREKCVGCHHRNRTQGELDLSTYAGILAGSESGKIVRSGDPEDSLLYLVITHQEEPAMPPEGEPLEVAKVEMIKSWIAHGMPETSEAAGHATPVNADRPISTSAAEPHRKAVSSFAGPSRLVFQPTKSNPVTALAVSAQLVARSGHKQVLLFDRAPCQFVDVLAFPEGDIFDLCFSADGTTMLAAGGQHAASGKVVLWDVQRRERLAAFGDEFDIVLAADLHPDGRSLLLGGAERVLKMIQIESGSEQYRLTKHTDWIFDVAFNPDGLIFASADRAGNLFVWEAETGSHIHTLRGHRGAIHALDWFVQADILVTGGQDGTIRTWDVHTGKQENSWPADDGGVLGLTVLPDNSIVTIGRSGQLARWNPQGKLLREVNQTPHPTRVASFADDVLLGLWNGILTGIDEQLKPVNTYHVPADRRTDSMASLAVEPRLAQSFRTFAGAPDAPLDVVTPRTSSPSRDNLEVDSTNPFDQILTRVSTEAEAFERISQETQRIEQQVSKLEERAAISPRQLALAGLLNSLKQNQKVAFTSGLGDLEVLLRVAVEKAEHDLIASNTSAPSNLEAAHRNQLISLGDELRRLEKIVREHSSRSLVATETTWQRLIHRLELASHKLETLTKFWSPN